MENRENNSNHEHGSNDHNIHALNNRLNIIEDMSCIKRVHSARFFEPVCQNFSSVLFDLIHSLPLRGGGHGYKLNGHRCPCPRHGHGRGIYLISCFLPYKIT